MTKAIKFYADWCGPCKMYSKTWDKVVEKYEGQVEFIEVNVDKDTTGLAAEYKIKSIPFTVVEKGEKTISKVGMLQLEELEKLILN